MRWPQLRGTRRLYRLWPIVPSFLLLIFVVHIVFGQTYGAQLGYRALQLGNDEVDQVTDYQLSFTLASPGTLGSVRVQFCSNDPLPDDACVAPVGFDISKAQIVQQDGVTGFSVAASTTANTLVVTRQASAVSVTPASLHLSGVKNPSDPGSYYARVQTYASTDASGSGSDYGGIAFAITSALTVSAEVPPYLIFCTGITIANYNCANAVGDYIDFGELSSAHASSGSSQFLVATNAGDGYVISMNGTSMTSGNNEITPLSSNDVSRPGTSQFGFNLVANTTPQDGASPSGAGTSVPASNYSQPNSYRFVPGDTLVSSLVPNEVRLFTASYIVNVPPTQAPGIYVSTITYICLANF